MYYPHAVFPTDKSLQWYDYPIKSGYYFDPLGQYTCTVTTVQYKNSRNNTNEHRELVDKLKDAFHYQSQLQYTNDGVNYESLDITNRNNTVFGMNLLTINTNYNKNTKRLAHATDSTGTTHTYFKEILEGYRESNTENSYSDFKYREYIKSGNIYKVTETTKITFTVAPPAGNHLYTRVKMPDGDYAINVWMENVDLNRYKYSGLNINGINTIDNMTVTVTGSMYDDLNN